MVPHEAMNVCTSPQISESRVARLRGGGGDELLTEQCDEPESPPRSRQKRYVTNLYVGAKAQIEKLFDTVMLRDGVVLSLHHLPDGKVRAQVQLSRPFRTDLFVHEVNIFLLTDDSGPKGLGSGKQRHIEPSGSHLATREEVQSVDPTALVLRCVAI